jgi:hypothetical protein
MTRASTYTLARGGLVLFLAAFHTSGAQPTYLTPANTPFSSPQLVIIACAAVLRGTCSVMIACSLCAQLRP